jgi:hypothetical protein
MSEEIRKEALEFAKSFNIEPSEEELAELMKTMISTEKKLKEDYFKEEKYKWFPNKERNKLVLRHKKANSTEYISTNHEMPIEVLGTSVINEKEE